MRWAFLLVGAVVAAAPLPAAPQPVRVGSKKFTESVVLGELAVHAAHALGLRAEHVAELGGTRILWNALRAGELDLYPDYTGTLAHELLHRPELAGDLPALRAALAESDLGLIGPLGFDNTYALGMRRARARALGIRRISDLRAHPELRLGFSAEFLRREDGWPGLARRYGLSSFTPRALDHDVAYRAVAEGALDVIDLYATDAEIAFHDLVVLEDDLGYFPHYEAVYVFRRELARRAPALLATLRRLRGRISATEMAAANAAAKLERRPERQVAAELLERELGLTSDLASRGLLARLARRTAEHVLLVGVSLLLAILVALPLGILAAKRPRLGGPVLAACGILQTIPSLALLVVMIPLLGIGALPAIAAMFLYGLLPIVRNTAMGLTSIPQPLRESAAALDLSDRARLRWIELPLAAPAILAGIKTAAVIDVGTATLGALVGAGGYGEPILSGIRLADHGLILEGAIPAALLAILVQTIVPGSNVGESPVSKKPTS